jgi:hypothetical protein
MIYRTYPRLPDLQATVRFEEVSSMGVDACRKLEEPWHESVYFSDGTGVPKNEIRKLQEKIRIDLVDDYLDSGLSGVGNTDFDRDLGAFLLDNLQMTPYEASQKQVWSFISLYVIPEVGLWRFPKLTKDRFIGNPLRNSIGRTWWRAYILGPDLGAAKHDAEPLGENELYPLIEKTTIGLNQNLAQLVADAIYRKQKKSTNRDKFVEEFTKDILRILPSVQLNIDDEDFTSAFLDDMAESAFKRAMQLVIAERKKS